MKRLGMSNIEKKIVRFCRFANIIVKSTLKESAMPSQNFAVGCHERSHQNSQVFARYSQIDQGRQRAHT